ncbi:uncharacterized protein [Montipora foliosa]|uniref:uncharacterized protein n=1 Tax=Montipora foliosa TaxID=591990 RepID=UPI0035F1A35A
MSCHQSCLRNAWCTSTNFKESFNRGDKTICELNVHQLPSANIVYELVHQPGVTFAMFFKGCQISGCLNGGSCLFDTEKKSFFCLCKQPWNGSNCEIKTSSSTENASRSISSSSLVSFSPSDSVFQPSFTSANVPQHISPATTAAVYSSANQSLHYISSSPSMFQSSSSTVAGASQSILSKPSFYRNHIDKCSMRIHLHLHDIPALSKLSPSDIWLFKFCLHGLRHTP